MIRLCCGLIEYFADNSFHWPSTVPRHYWIYRPCALSWLALGVLLQPLLSSCAGKLFYFPPLAWPSFFLSGVSFCSSSPNISLICSIYILFHVGKLLTGSYSAHSSKLTFFFQNLFFCKNFQLGCRCTYALLRQSLSNANKWHAAHFHLLSNPQSLPIYVLHLYAFVSRR